MALTRAAASCMAGGALDFASAHAGGCAAATVAEAPVSRGGSASAMYSSRALANEPGRPFESSSWQHDRGMGMPSCYYCCCHHHHYYYMIPTTTITTTT